MKINGKRTVVPLAMLVLALQFALAPWTALAETGAAATEGQINYSNLIAIEELAELADGVEDTEEQAPDGATRVSVKWEPDDTNAPDSVTAIIIGSGTPKKVVLEKEQGWKKTVMLESGTVAPTYSLLQVSDYSVTEGEGSLVFTVNLGEASPPSELELEIVPDETQEPAQAEPSVVISANVGAGEELFYGQEITMTGTLTGYDDATYTLEWQVDKGNGWEAIDGANGLSHTIILEEFNVMWAYRLYVVIAE